MEKVDEYFVSIILGQDNKIEIKVEETEKHFGGVWYCYLNVKLAQWISNEFD